ncbi:MAG: hypothetical protein KA715_12265 [Xanthomonadaceae bacterium]|nr:hypothetical protein [Xanthomonadaceae bacterium]
MNLFLVLVSLLSVQAQQIIDQEDLLKEGLRNRAFHYVLNPIAFLYQRHTQPQFSDVIK